MKQLIKFSCALCLLGGMVSSSAALKDGLEYVYGEPPAAEFELAGLHGKTWRLSDLKGKVLIVNFWATWCPPCLEELPSMQSAWKDLHGDRFELLAINVGEDAEAVNRFLAEFGTPLEFPILLDSTMQAFQSWSVRGLPTSFVINKAGGTAYKAEGGRDMASDSVRALLRKLMDK